MSAQKPATPLVLTIDIGTSSVRAMLFDAAGRAVPGVEARETYAVLADASGAAEEDAEALLARVERCVDAALAQAGGLARQIGAVALDTLVSNMVALDESGRPLTALITYADTRNDADAVALRRELDERAVHQRTGCLLRTSYWPARLAWLRRTQPDVFGRAARFATIGELLELRLFGRCRVSSSVASWSGLLDRAALRWDAPLLRALGVAEDRLAPLADASEPLTELLPAYAKRWPALAEIPWYPAIGDGAAANLGSGCVGPGRVALTVGTTGALRAVLPEVARVPAGLWCYQVARGRSLLGGATSEGGNVYAWMRAALALGDSEAIDAALAALPPDGHGLTVLPFFAGERSPGWAGDARATVSGLTLATTPLEIARAGLESVAYRFALIGRSLLDATGGAGQLIASGGALLASPLWMQIIADALGQPLVASAEPEATSRGAAILALESLGAIGAIDDLPAELGAAYEPDAERHAIYAAATERQQRLYARLIGESG